MDRFKILLSGLFFIYLILDGFKNSISFYIAIVLLLGSFFDWYFGRQKETTLLEKNTIEEDFVFDMLDNLMRKYELEMRLRRAGFKWNVSLLKSDDGIVRIMGRGSAPTIPEAIMRAESDFEKRTGEVS